MPDRGTRRWAAGTMGVMAAALALYTWRLGEAPVHLSPDEAIIATEAYAIATSGRDTHGTWLPLYVFIQVPGDTRSGWFTPAIFYASAAVFQLFPLSEWSARLATVVVAVTSIGLLHALALRLFRSHRLALGTVALFALAPGHYILSRYALDYVFPVPFILGWLLCLWMAIERRSTLYAAAAGLCLGLGFYSYIASMIMMPLYAALTCLVLVKAGASRRLVAAMMGGAAVPLLAFAAWFVQHPGAFAETAGRYGLYDTGRLSALQGLREFLSFPNAERMASLYWSFFNPGFLFFSGDAHMTFSTRAAGVFSLSALVLLPAGLAQVLGRERTPFALLLAAGLATAPAAAVLVPEAAALNRAVALLPFGALIGGFGLRRLAALPPVRLSPGVSLGHGRVLAAALVAGVCLQFGTFARDYFGDYRLRSSPWLGGNVRGALEALIDLDVRGGVPAVYFADLQSEGRLSDTRNRWMPAYWRFYTTRHRRPELQARSDRLSAIGVDRIAPGSLVLANVGDPDTSALVASGTLQEVARIPELAGDPFFRILAKP